MNSQLKSHLGPIRLDKLTAAHIDRVLRSWEQTLQPSTVRATVATVSAALEQACRWGLIPANPARLATKPRVPRRRATLPTLEQVVGLIDTRVCRWRPHHGGAAQLGAGDRTAPRRAVRAAMAGPRRGQPDSSYRPQPQARNRPLDRWRTQDPPSPADLNRRNHVDMLKGFRALRATTGLGGQDHFLFSWQTVPANPDAVTERSRCLTV